MIGNNRMLGFAALVTVLLIPLVRAEAGPIQLPLRYDHEIKMKFDDRAELFESTNGAGAAVLELRGIYNITSIVDAGVSGLGNTPIDMTGVEVTGTYYDLEWFKMWDDSAGAFVSAPTSLAGLAGVLPAAGDVMLFRPSGRNPLSGGAGRDGGVITMYSDTTPTATPWTGAAAPSLWTEGGPGMDAYTGASEGENILNAVFHNLEDLGLSSLGGADLTDAAADGAVLGFQMTTGFDLLGGGSGSSLQNYLDVVGGTWATTIMANGMPVSGSPGVFADIRQLINIDEVAGGIGTIGATGFEPDTSHRTWDTVSDDPIRYIATPEPASLLVWLTLAGLGSSGFAIRRRRKMSKVR